MERISDFDRIAVDLAEMGGLVEGQLSDAIFAIERRDLPLAEQVTKSDIHVDRREREIETRVMRLIETGRLQGPAVRSALSALRIAAALERVGDLAKNVAKRALVISRQSPRPTMPAIARMGRISLRQVSDVLNASGARSAKAAVAVWGADEELDELYNSLFREILLEMMNDPSAVNTCTHLVFVAKNFERIGDHATNIAEAVYYDLTGERLTDTRPKVDMTSLMGPSADGPEE